MTINDIIAIGRQIAAETAEGGNTAARVGGVIEAIGEILKNQDYMSWQPAGNFDIEEYYEKDNMVFDEETNSCYVSLQTDNVGHPVNENDESYEEGWWMKVIDGASVLAAAAAATQAAAEANQAAEAARGIVYQAVDDHLDTESLKPVANQVVTQAINNLSENLQDVEDEVTDEIMTTPQSWNLSYGGDFTWELGTIHDDGKAWNSSSFYHLYIPISGDMKGMFVRLKANSAQPAYYAFFQRVGFSYTNTGGDVSTYYSSGYTNKITIPAGQEATFVIPDDCNYIYIECGQINGTSRIPQSNGYFEYKWEKSIEDLENSIGDLHTWFECDAIYNIAGAINAGGGWYNVNLSTFKSGQAYVKSGQLYRVTASASYPASLQWLTASDIEHANGDNAPVLSGTSQIVIPANTSVILEAPEGAAVLNFLDKYFGQNRRPLIEDGESIGIRVKQLSMVERTIPKVGCGTTMVSRPEDTYAHAPLILENVDYRFIIYQGSTEVTIEDGVGTTYSHVMLVHNKKTNEDKYIKVFDVENKDVIDGNTCTIYYNETATFIGNSNVILIRTGCHLDDKWVQIYKTYNADTQILSSASLQHLSYGGNTFDFNLANYLTMCNTLYGTSLTVSQVRYTNQINNITYYNSKYYCVNALIPATDVVVPHIFMVSNDAITWTPVAMLQSAHSSETQVAIKDDIVYYAYREMNLGTFYMVFDLSGNILKAATNMSSMPSKPTIVYNAKRNKIIVGYNAVLGSTSNRVKMTIAEINTTDYSLTDIKSYVNSNGWNYFYFYVKPNGNMLSVSVEDSRNFNGGVLNQQTTTDVRIEEIDLLEILNT